MISVSDLSIKQGDFSLDQINFEIRKGEYAILMGENGSGKTTLVEAICGLRKIRSGTITLGGRDISHAQPAQRSIGYVPQDSVLFPAMRVDHQIAFGLKVRRIDSKTSEQRVNELAELLQIKKILNRYPRGLSGGEKQRVALARALSYRPSLVCLDEPLSALDENARNRMMQLLKEIQSKEAVTFLHITHSSSESSKLGTIQYRLNSGIVERIDPANQN